MNGTLRRRRLRRLFVPSLVAVALASSACTGNGVGDPGSSTTTQQQNPTSPVRELSSIETLREAFNDDAGRTRLILIISPT